MKLTKFNPKNLFKIKKPRSSSLSRSSDQQFGSSSSSSSDRTPTSVLPLSYYQESKFSENDSNLELIQAFKLIDKDGDGKISINEFISILKSIGSEKENEEEEELLNMFKEIDRDGDGYINLEEFSLIRSAFEPSNNNYSGGSEEIRDVFELFDLDGNGKISAEELLGFFMKIGDDKCTLDECKRMITSVDSDGDGFVCFDDFSRMMGLQR